jgi:hypothetical protein
MASPELTASPDDRAGGYLHWLLRDTEDDELFRQNEAGRVSIARKKPSCRSLRTREPKGFNAFFQWICGTYRSNQHDHMSPEYRHRLLAIEASYEDCAKRMGWKSNDLPAMPLEPITSLLKRCTRTPSTQN